MSAADNTMKNLPDYVQNLQSMLSIAQEGSLSTKELAPIKNLADSVLKQLESPKQNPALKKFAAPIKQSIRSLEAAIALKEIEGATSANTALAKLKQLTEKVKNDVENRSPAELRTFAKSAMDIVNNATMAAKQITNPKQLASDRAEITKNIGAIQAAIPAESKQTQSNADRVRSAVKGPLSQIGVPTAALKPENVKKTR